MLLGEMSDAQGLGEAGGAGRVELHITDAARDNKIAHRETGQLPFAVTLSAWSGWWPGCV